MGNEKAMKFIEMTGEILAEIVNDNELHDQNLSGAGVSQGSIVRINQHGDIAVSYTHLTLPTIYSV